MLCRLAGFYLAAVRVLVCDCHLFDRAWNLGFYYCGDDFRLDCRGPPATFGAFGFCRRLITLTEWAGFARQTEWDVNSRQ